MNRRNLRIYALVHPHNTFKILSHNALIAKIYIWTLRVAWIQTMIRHINKWQSMSIFIVIKGKFTKNSLQDLELRNIDLMNLEYVKPIETSVKMWSKHRILKSYECLRAWTVHTKLNSGTQPICWWTDVSYPVEVILHACYTIDLYISLFITYYTLHTVLTI